VIEPANTRVGLRRSRRSRRVGAKRELRSDASGQGLWDACLRVAGLEAKRSLSISFVMQITVQMYRCRCRTK
jgi:hypothetical protein